MSDNVSKFEPNPGRALRKKILIFVLIFVLVAAVVALYVFRDRLNLDAARRFVRYLGVQTDQTSGSFTFDFERYEPLPNQLEAGVIEKAKKLFAQED